MSATLPLSVFPRSMTAVAALGSNRVIGAAGSIPWHLPEDFRHFKAATMGGILLMGRATYESIGRPLPGRETVVMSRTLTPFAGVTVVRGWDEVPELFPGRKLFLAGGAQLYAEGLPFCEELLLTHVNLEPPGDAFFPEYESLFDAGEVLSKTPDFLIRRHRRRHTA